VRVMCSKTADWPVPVLLCCWLLNWGLLQALGIPYALSLDSTPTAALHRSLEPRA
jgi:hypothetical protein